jgi:hypothetical protein
MRIVLFLDLDDTIFQTLPKCPGGEPVRPVAYHRDGTPLSYMTERQRTLLDWFLQSATVIPTTGRNRDAFRRVDLPFAHGAILNFGGVVLLADGTPDKMWDGIIRPQALELAPEFSRLCRSVARFIDKRGLGARARIITDLEMPLYVVIKHPNADLTALQAIREEHLPSLDLERFAVHCNDNNLSLVPRFLGKEKAVRHVLEHQFGSEGVLTLGMGDSLSDVPYLELCDYSLTPRLCQLASHRRSGLKDL